MKKNLQKMIDGKALGAILVVLLLFLGSNSINAQSFSATWPFTSASLKTPTVTGTSNASVTASDVLCTPGTIGSGSTAVFGTATFANGLLTGTGISGRAATSCTSLYNAVGTATPYIEYKIAPISGYSMTTNSFTFTVKQTVVSTGSLIAAGYSVNGGSSFTGLAAPTGGGTGATVAVSPAGSYVGTTAGTFTFTVPAATIAATNSFILRIVIWRNNASQSSSAAFEIAPPVITGSTAFSVSPVITAPNPGTLSNFNYIAGAGPSVSKSFVVAGTNLTDALVVTPASDYEISSDNATFSTTPISLTPTTGTVAATTLFTRLAAGKLAGTYSNRYLNITSTNAATQSVVCSGYVTANYSYDGSGSLADVNNWGDASDGTGNHPVNFTSNYQYFTIKNTTAVATDLPWTVSGTNSKIIVGSSSSPAVTLTIASGANIIGGPVDLSSASSGSNRLVVADTAFLTSNIGTLDTNSTLEFQVTPVVASTRSTYENNILVSGGTFSHAPAGGAANVTGNVTVTGGSFVLAGTSTSTISGNVTVTGGTFMTNSSSITGNVTVSGTGIFNLNTGGSARTLTLNGNLDVSGTGGIVNSGVPASSGSVQAFHINLSGTGKSITYTATGSNLTKTNFYVIGTYTLSGDLDYTSAGTTVFVGGAIPAQGFFTRQIGILSTGSLTLGANKLIMGNSLLTLTAPGTLIDESRSIVETTCPAYQIHTPAETNEVAVAQLAILPSKTWLGTVKYNYGSGTYGQKIVDGTYNNLVLNNSYGAELSGNVTVNGVLTFTAGKITTGANTLTIGTSASIVGAGTGWVVGNLKKLTASGVSPSFTFAIGDANTYAPLVLTFSGNTSAAGGLTASTAAGDHSAIASSYLNATKSVNRTWTLTNYALADFGTYSANFTYAGADNDAIVTSSNYKVGKYDGTSWSYFTTNNSTNTSSAAAVSGFGDFAIAEYITAPTASAQTFCNSGTVADLVATGTAIKWYAAATGGSALDSSVELTSGSYYASQTINNIESARTLVSVIRNNTAVPTASSQTFCNSGTVANLVATGTDLKWYAAANGGSALASSTVLATGNYYASQTLNACESARTEVAVVRNNTVAPTATSQTFCNSGTVVDLVATGTDLKWYAAANGGSALASSASLVTGNYYVSQTVNSCESARTEVTVVRNNTAAPGSESQVFCSSGTVANLVATGSDLKWYAATTGGDALASDVALTSGNYYVSQTANGCESPRTLVAVTVTDGIAVQPVSTTICSVLNSTASISVVATPGTSATYAWYVSTVLKPTWTIISTANSGTAALPMYTNYNTATLNIKKQALLVAGNKYRVVVTNGFCGGTVTSNEVTLTVNPISVVKTITGAGAICNGGNKVLTLATGSVGSTKWQSNVSSSTTAPLATDANWTDIAGTTDSATYTASPTTTTWYRVVATSGACSSVASAAVAVTVSQPTAVGTLSALATTVCKGGSTTLTLTSATGTISWQKALVTNGTPGTFAAVAGNTTTSLTTAALAATTAYKVVVSSGACTSSSSEPITITVSPVSVVKAITGAGAICNGSSKVLTLTTGSVGTTKWQSNVSESATAPVATDTNWTDIAETTNVVTYTASPTTTTWYRVVATSGACSSIASAGVKVTVNQPTAVGLLSSNTTVCTGSGTTLNLESATGTIAWQKAAVTNGTPGTFAAVAGNVSTTLTTPNLTATTAYKVVVSSGACSASTSNVVIVTVSPLAKATAISGFNTNTVAAQVCVGTPRRLTLAAGYVGTIEWLSSTTLAGTYNPIDGATGSTYDYTPTTAGAMYFKVRLTSLPCSAQATSAAGVAVFAKACATMAENNDPMPTSKVATPFAVKAYPNPSDSIFQLNFTTSSESQIEMRVYDMIGKLIETRQFSTTEMNNQEVGNSYPTGIYNVIVTQGEEMKTLRVIKK